MEPTDLCVLRPYGTAPVVEVPLPPRRSWWKASKRDLLLLIALVPGGLAVLVRSAGGPGKAVVVRSLHDSQIWLPLGMVAVLIGAVWVVSRVWRDGGPSASSSIALGAVATVLSIAACFLYGIVTALGFVLSNSTTFEDFTAPGSGESFVLRTDTTGGETSHSVYRGGPWTFDRVPAVSAGEPFGIDYDSYPPVLNYPTGDGQTRMTVPVE